MKAYYGSRISEHMTVTPEGFLVCLSVPIARCGPQQYLPEEVGLDGDAPLNVMRLPDHVFSARALASFEGKPVTLDHPPAGVEPHNACAYQKGHAQNIRRGTGELGDLMLADLFITDPELIRMIRFGGVREISCGYECEYEHRDDGQVVQKDIRGNHIAVVTRGRAGSRVAIKDSMQRGGKRHMKRTEKNTLLGRMFAGWARDAQPDEVAQAVEALCERALNEAEFSQAEAEPFDGSIAGLIKAIEALIRKLDEKFPAIDSGNPMEALLNELSGEEALVIEEGERDLPGGEPAAEGESMPDPEMAMAAIQAIRPIIAKLPRSEQFAASDAAARQIRRAMGKPVRPRTNGYKLAARGQTHAAIARDERDIGK